MKSSGSRAFAPMTAVAILLSGTAFAARAIEAGAPGEAAATLPAPAARIAAAIAHEWRVDPSLICIEWGRGAEAIPADAPFRLVGKGTDGCLALAWKASDRAPSGTERAIRLRAGIMDTVWVAARPLPAGAHIAAGDVRPEPRVRWGPPAVQAVEAPGIDWEVRRPLASGDVVVRPSVVPPRVILAGDEVRVDWRRGDLLITLNGIALNSARRGESLRIRIAGRREPVVATAASPGVALFGTGGNR